MQDQPLTTVINVATGWTLDVPLSPRKAVFAAYLAEQAERGHEAHKRKGSYLGRVHETPTAVACGNWIAFKD